MFFATHQVLMGLFRLSEREDLRVNSRMNIVCFDGSNHVPGHGPRAHERAAGGAYLAQALENALRDSLTVEKSDGGDDTLYPLEAVEAV